mmetsp:Transcript_58585/g.170014  ORF Transcript_58585/g.170014 Transcript_58585/m.170014 type:complete len:293 (-) Transcript_58585:527-1405(-)
MREHVSITAETKVSSMAWGSSASNNFTTRCTSECAECGVKERTKVAQAAAFGGRPTRCISSTTVHTPGRSFSNAFIRSSSFKAASLVNTPLVAAWRTTASASSPRPKPRCQRTMASQPVVSSICRSLAAAQCSTTRSSSPQRINASRKAPYNAAPPQASSPLLVAKASVPRRNAASAPARSRSLARARIVAAWCSAVLAAPAAQAPTSLAQLAALAASGTQAPGLAAAGLARRPTVVAASAAGAVRGAALVEAASAASFSEISAEPMAAATSASFPANEASIFMLRGAMCAS